MLVLVLDHSCFVFGGCGCVASLSSTINPPSTLSRIVHCRMDVVVVVVYAGGCCGAAVAE